MNNITEQTLELLEIIDYSENVYNILADKDYFKSRTSKHNFLKLLSGIGFINTVYEKFSKTILKIYCKLKNENIDKYIRYKSIAKIKEFVNKLNLDLEYHFNLKFPEIYPKTDYNGMLQLFLDSYRERCDYLHGDFLLNENITMDKFKNNVIEILEKEITIMKILRDTFLNEIPNILILES